VCGSHGRAIHTLSIRGKTPAQPAWSAVNAGNLGVSCTPVKTIVDIKEVGNSLGNKSIIVPRRYPRPTVLSYSIPINRLGSRSGDVLSAIPQIFGERHPERFKQLSVARRHERRKSHHAAPKECRKLGSRHRAESAVAAHRHSFSRSLERRLRLKPSLCW
jgi:hypothetical protein